MRVTGILQGALVLLVVGTAAAQSPNIAAVEDARTTLRQFRLGEDDLASIRQHIENLGSDDFRTREAATEALLKYPTLPLALLHEAAKSDDAEVQVRAQQILARRSDDHAQRVLADVLKKIAAEKLPGLGEEIVGALEQGSDASLRTMASEAIVATSRAEDETFLLKALSHKSSVVRGAAIAALVKLEPRKHLDAVAALLDDHDEQVQFAAAWALGNQGDRRALAALVKLLESEDLMLRLRSSQALAALSGEKIPFAPTGEAKVRKSQAERWNEWARGPGATAKLKFPIEATGEIPLLAEGLAAWEGVLQGRQLPAKKLERLCTLKGDVLHFPDSARGYLRTREAYASYRLTLEYRWPRDGINDGGLMLFVRGEDSLDGNALEVQTHQGNAGDFYTLGDFPGGHLRQGVGSRMAPASDKPRGEWNRVDIEVQKGTAVVKINDVLMNKAVGCPAEPTKFGIRLEGSALEVRNVLLLPLE